MAEEHCTKGHLFLLKKTIQTFSFFTAGKFQQFQSCNAVFALNPFAMCVCGLREGVCTDACELNGTKYFQSLSEKQLNQNFCTINECITDYIRMCSQDDNEGLALDS